MFQLTVETDNAAFQDGESTSDGWARNTEIARILRAAADRLMGGEDKGDAHDANGNRVGSFETV